MKHICYKHDHVEKKEVGILIFVREIKHFWCTFLQAAVDLVPTEIRLP